MAGHSNPMDLTNMVHDMDPPQPLGGMPQEISSPAPTNPDPPQALQSAQPDSAAVGDKIVEQFSLEIEENDNAKLIATADADVPMVDAADNIPTPAEDATVSDAVSDILSNAESSSTSRTYDLQQLGTQLEGVLEQVVDDIGGGQLFDEMLKVTCSFYQKLGDNQKALVTHKFKELLEQLGFVPNKEPVNFGSPRKRKFECGSTRQATPGSSFLESTTQEDSASDACQCEMSLDLGALYGSGKEHPLINFYQELLGGAVCERIRKYAKDQSEGNRPTPATDYATDLPPNNRETTISTLIQKICEYESGEEQAPAFCKTWENLVLADLVKPEWDAFKDSEQTKLKPNFVRFVHNYWKLPKSVPKKDWVIYKMLAEKMSEGWYWGEWCRSLSKESDVHHRGASLLLLALTSRMTDTALKEAIECVPKAVPWLQRAAEMLNPWATRLYQRPLNDQELDELKAKVCKIIGG